ncbi:metal-dependent hydrolase family protein [Microbaculum marinum]|uniref:Amidohydrolase family protein n=1 Tax=Microbaculum marinum TaxID=1764581 RepID=A0AAW9S1Z5_9HYPH
MKPASATAVAEAPFLHSRNMPMLAFTNARVFDGLNDGLKDATVLVEGERIKSVSEAPPPAGAEIVDCGGRVLMPGLIDAHIHAYFYDMNVTRLQRLPVTMYAHHAANMLGDMLDRGFTSVRDTGGADYGLWLAIRDGLIKAPRLFYCEKALSQTGGHVDMRHQHEFNACDDHLVACGCCHANPLGVVVDGVDAVRRVVRENLRRGASFIKFCGSGGASTTSDPLDGIQFSNDEVRAIVEEVENHLVYCTAHIHPDRALKRAVELGVHCIEHGTLIEPDTARMAADRGTYIVPTLAVIAGLAEKGELFGYPPESIAKIDRIKGEAIERLNHMKDAGVKVGFGTDLIGAIQPMQCIEFSLRAPVFSNFEILHQATGMNAEIIGAKGDLGTIAADAYADIIVVDGNPLEDLKLMEDDGAHIPIVMKGGQFHRNRLEANP